MPNANNRGRQNLEDAVKSLFPKALRSILYNPYGRGIEYSVLRTPEYQYYVAGFLL
jgi:hypothetical protein